MYYACFYMTTALLMKRGYSASTHSGVIRLFGLHFVSTGMVDREIGKFPSNYLSVDSRVKSNIAMSVTYL